MTDFSDIEDDFFTGKEHTPLHKDAFLLSPDEKIEKIENFSERLCILWAWI